MTLNFGPNHPAAHGILRLTLQLQGEVLQRVDPQFGFLHRGSEKLAEMRNYLQTLPYFDRFDYVANIFQEHAYCLALEMVYTSRDSFLYCLNYVRTLFDELSRILNHLLTLSATCLDLGSMGPIF
jgi:NADH-quinone oxidoreductase subunit D